jgi:uncharacterized repeat protein (TIGR03803 family)
MKSRTLVLITAMTVFVATLAVPLRLAAQDSRNQVGSRFIASTSAQRVLPSAPTWRSASASPMTLAQAPASLRAAVRAKLGRINKAPGATQQAELTASDGGPNDLFGTSVAIDGFTAVVGAPGKNLTNGAAYVFVRSGTTWTQQAELIASDGAPNDQFGFSVAISGSTAVVGAYEKNSYTGAAYVFVRSGTTWTQQAELTASDGAGGDAFGISVAISGSTAVVGAEGKNFLAGVAYVFVSSGTTWTQQAELTASDTVTGELFGVSVAISDSTAVVGAIGYNVSFGAVYVFVRSGTTWTQQAELTASDGVADDGLGYSVAVSGSTVVAGAPGKNSSTGAAYVFVRSGTTWTQQAELTASDGAPQDAFGTSVASSGSTAVAGALGGNTVGAAYVFMRSGTTWTQQDELTASDGTSGDAFGLSVAISGSTAVVGARNKGAFMGAAYVFVLPPKLTPLHSFNSTDGATPYAGLVQAVNGNLYGTTSAGGAFNNGTVFKITPTGTLTTVYNFCAQSGCPDGASPYATLVQATNGNLYGTTSGGGANGGGTVFKITLNGRLTTLYSFCSQGGCTDGQGPNHALIQASNGNLYGTTFQGGANSVGTVFKITPSGTWTKLHDFGSSNDGSSPEGDLVEATDGNLYGTTHLGGDNDDGTVFKMTLGGTLTTVYRFCAQSGCLDGAKPDAGLVQGADGKLYGTTFSGGVNALGTVFKITLNGRLTSLYSFCPQNGCPDGAGPEAALVQAADGNFYGTTISFGVNGHGTIFRITPSGTLTTLYNFCAQSNCPDGAFPQATLLQDTNGTFYGTTPSGGANNDGTVFSLSVGLDPFVTTLPASGRVGAGVGILGTDLTDATSLTFNGTPAAFNVASGSLITSSVPAGATTGFVDVTTSLGTLTSNRKFLVAP